MKFDLKKFRKDMSLLQVDIAKVLECTQPNVSAIEGDGKDLEDYQYEKLYSIYGKDVIDRYTIDKQGSSSNSNTEGPLIPLLPIAAQGGTLKEFIVSVKDSDTEHIVSPIKGVDFAITVAGDSMAPEYPNGSQILIKKIDEKAFIDWGKAYV